MATAQAPKVQIDQITIDGKKMTQQHTTINNHDLIEFHVSNFDNHKYCKLTICAIEYTDADKEPDAKAVQLKSTTGGGVIALGTIKIGS